MRIVCEKCSAAYAIDDKLVTPKGVRAQCPRCRNLQLVRKEESAPGPAFAALTAAPPPSAIPRAAPAAPPQAAPPPPPFEDPFSDLAGFGTAPEAPSDAFESIDFTAEPTSPGPAFPPPPAPPMPPAAPPGAQGNSPSGWLDPFAGLDPAPRPPPPPPVEPKVAPVGVPSAGFLVEEKTKPRGVGLGLVKSNPGSASPVPPRATSSVAGAVPLTTQPGVKRVPGAKGELFDLGGHEPVPSGPQPAVAQAGAGDPFDFSGLELPPPPPPQPQPGARGAPPSAPEQGRPPPSAPRAGMPESGAGVNCRTCGKALTDPFDQAIGVCDDCRNEGPPPPGAELSADAGTDKVDSTVLARMTPPSASAAPAAPAPRPAKPLPTSALREGVEPDGGRTRAIGIGVGVAVLLAVGAFVVVKRPFTRKPPPLSVRVSAAADKPIDAMVQKWQARFPEISGSAEEHLDQGEASLQKDTTQGYLDAEAEFQKALVLNSKSDRAVAGWVLAMVFGRAKEIDDATAQAAEAMLTAAGQRSGDSRVFIAHAHLLLARNGDVNSIRPMAERGTTSSSDKDKALAYLALGQLQLSKNPEYAAADFARAEKLDPRLKRASLFQSQLLITQGALKQAAELVERRLEADPDQFEASVSLAQLYVEVSELPLARRALERALKADASNVKARIALDVLAYQHEGHAAEAVKDLTELTADRDGLEKAQLVEALGHLASAQRVLGANDAALTAAQGALALAPDDLNAHLQCYFAALAVGQAAEARTHLPPLRGKLGDPQLDDLLEGRMLLEEKRYGDAYTKLLKVADADPRRVDALLLAAAAAARDGKEGRAWELALKRGLKADPFQPGPVPVLTARFFRPADLLAGARGSFASLSRGADDPNPSLAAGLVEWFSGEPAAADRHFAVAAADDPRNGPAFSYRALIALRRRAFAEANGHVTKALAVARALPLAHAAQGLVAIALNKAEAGKKAFAEALRLDPGLLVAVVQMALLDAQLSLSTRDPALRKQRLGDARHVLTNVLLKDPAYLEARRALYNAPS